MPRPSTNSIGTRYVGMTQESTLSIFRYSQVLEFCNSSLSRAIITIHGTVKIMASSQATEMLRMAYHAICRSWYLSGLSSAAWQSQMPIHRCMMLAAVNRWVRQVQAGHHEVRYGNTPGKMTKMLEPHIRLGTKIICVQNFRWASTSLSIKLIFKGQLP